MNCKKNKGGCGCGRFWNVGVASSLQKRVRRFFFGMMRFIGMNNVEWNWEGCYSFIWAGSKNDRICLPPLPL